MVLKTPDAVIPEPLAVRDPVPHRTEPRGDEAIAALSAMPLLGHETGIAQDAEVLGDGWAAHLETSLDRVHGAIGLDEEIEHPAARGMARCPEDIRLAIGRHHHVANNVRRYLRAKSEVGLVALDARVHQVCPRDSPRMRMCRFIGEAKCYETVRAMRWPDGVTCPPCPFASVIKDGRDGTEPPRHRDLCHGRRRRFDDLTGTIVAGHHEPLQTRIICLYFMGPNPSGLHVAGNRESKAAGIGERVEWFLGEVFRQLVRGRGRARHRGRRGRP
jgi:hypothetical protein